MSVDITITDNSESVKHSLDNAILRALERMGMQAEGYIVIYSVLSCRNTNLKG